MIRLVLSVLTVLSGDPATSPKSEPNRPNVVLILADDLGATDLGCYGARDLVTPHLDDLAARGVRLTQFYAASSVCSPSRAGLLTGRYPVRCGVSANCSHHRGGPGWLPPEEQTLGEMFRAAGYDTAHIGKWHLGFTPETIPNRQGFEFSFGHMSGCIDNYSHSFFLRGGVIHDLYRNDVEVFQNGEYFPTVMVREASRFIEQPRDRPFFLYFALNAPHYPYQPEAKWIERFRNLQFPRNLYAAFLAGADEHIGQLLQKLDELDLRRRTIVVFQSDNGHSEEEFAHFGGGSAGRYRGAKVSLFEGGIRMPAIISWPGRLPEGVTRDQLLHACDWVPTLASLCNVPPPKMTLDGVDMRSILEHDLAPTATRTLHWEVDWKGTTQWAVREGDWKLISNAFYPSRQDETSIPIPMFLCNLKQDVSERVNLAGPQSAVLERLRQRHEEFSEGVRLQTGR